MRHFWCFSNTVGLFKILEKEEVADFRDLKKKSKKQTQQKHQWFLDSRENSIFKRQLHKRFLKRRAVLLHLGVQIRDENAFIISDDTVKATKMNWKAILMIACKLSNFLMVMCCSTTTANFIMLHARLDIVEFH